MAFGNCYEDIARAEAYSKLEFANTYYLAYRDLPAILREHVTGRNALDFGCGTGRSTRFAERLGFQVVGVDIAPKMIAKARELDPKGDYRLAKDDDLSQFAPGTYDLVLSLFTFDNVPGFETKVRLFRDLGALLNASGKIVSVVSSPEIYLHEWASFSTKDYPENRLAKSGDTVKIVTTDFPDRRPTEDILWTDESYREVYDRAELSVTAMYSPMATGDEPYRWVNETRIAPWVVYVLQRAGGLILAKKASAQCGTAPSRKVRSIDVSSDSGGIGRILNMRPDGKFSNSSSHFGNRRAFSLYITDTVFHHPLS